MNEPAIEISNLEVSFSDCVALSIVNLIIDSGLFVSVVGPNGGGKSTLLKVILGLIEIHSGSLKISGKSFKEIDPKLIGYVPQIKTLDRSFPALPIELIASGIIGKWVGRMSPELKEKSMEALELVGASHLAKRQLSRLSGGELQRIYLARSIARKPKLLLFDEPATGIDYVAEKDFNQLIDQYKKNNNTTIIMVTHDWETAYHHADFVLLLNRTPVCYDKPENAFTEEALRKTFGHMGHSHDMKFGADHHV